MTRGSASAHARRHGKPVEREVDGAEELAEAALDVAPQSRAGLLLHGERLREAVVHEQLPERVRPQHAEHDVELTLRADRLVAEQDAVVWGGAVRRRDPVVVDERQVTRSWAGRARRPQDEVHTGTAVAADLRIAGELVRRRETGV